ncbi:MAG: hypothetical protein EOM40_09750 [Clostridia bacterium]|nr:hypothetical protein [Clostridia bacterium]
MEELIKGFHQTWDEFPGAVRLIDKTNMTIACNKFAEENGLEAGQICAKIGAPENHKGCLKAMAIKTGTAQIDRPNDGRIRGWIPVEGYPDVVVHFSLALPETNK